MIIRKFVLFFNIFILYIRFNPDEMSAKIDTIKASMKKEVKPSSNQGMQMTTLVQKYIKFSQFIEDIRFGYALNCQEWDILLIIASAKLENKILRVNDLLAMDHIASPATIHKGIKFLISKKLVCFKINSQDGRVKFLHPTTKGMNLLEEISKKM